MEWFPPDPPPAVPHSNSCPLIEHDERARRLYSAGGSLANYSSTRAENPLEGISLPIRRRSRRQAGVDLAAPAYAPG